jgi:ATP-dependent DNA helicase RecG
MRQVLVYGRVQFFNGKYSIVHPEIEPFSPETVTKGLVPVYNTTEKMKARKLDS